MADNNIEIIGCEPDDNEPSILDIIPDYSGLDPVYPYDEPVMEVERSNGISAPGEVIAWEYFLWLAGMVKMTKGQKYVLPETMKETYFNLARKLHYTQFKVLVDHDDNRVADAKNLRWWFASLHSNYKEYTSIAQPGASILEVLVALVQRFDTNVMMNEEGIDRSCQWFWTMMKESSLDCFTDDKFGPMFNDDGTCYSDSTNDQICSKIIQDINERRYDPDGRGGFFPLSNPKSDQRKVELWYQMHAYFNEKNID